MEPTGKRVDFLRYACAELGLTGVEFAKERAEEAARKIWREQFDVASARAVAGTACAVRILPAAGQSRRAVHRDEGPRGDAEAKAAANAAEKAGGQYEETRAFTLPDGSARGLVFCKKNIADSDGLPPKRRKNCQEAVVTARKIEHKGERFFFPETAVYAMLFVEKHSIFGRPL